MVEQKKKQDEEARAERERCENERLVALKNKEKIEQSAVASTAVKQKLQVRNTSLLNTFRPCWKLPKPTRPPSAIFFYGYRDLYL